ncbi:MAG: AtpZ/AtpI family protein [Anaerolineales bacterium]|nr:AtpZ/AtpI family protein [Anaerolineales bacterium]
MKQFKSVFNLAAFGILGQVGCLTITIIAVAIGGGLLLDSYFQTRPWIMLGLVLVSIPVTLFLMVKIVLGAAPKLQMDSLPVGSDKIQEAPLNEEEPLGEHSGED